MDAVIDLRGGPATAAHIFAVLRLQAQFGHERAYSYLLGYRICPQLAQRVLAVRFERRHDKVGLQGIGDRSGEWGLAVRLP